jgi:hypothetical protein
VADWHTYHVCEDGVLVHNQYKKKHRNYRREIPPEALGRYIVNFVPHEEDLTRTLELRGKLAHRKVITLGETDLAKSSPVLEIAGHGNLKNYLMGEWLADDVALELNDAGFGPHIKEIKLLICEAAQKQANGDIPLAELFAQKLADFTRYPVTVLAVKEKIIIPASVRHPGLINRQITDIALCEAFAEEHKLPLELVKDIFYKIGATVNSRDWIRFTKEPSPLR